MKDKTNGTAPLAQIVADVRNYLDEKYAAREAALAHGRSLTRTCANAIRAMHRGEYEAARAAVGEAQAAADAMRETLAPHPDLLFAGYVQDAHKELAEASCLLAMLTGNELPPPQDLNIEITAYLNGLAEAASEGRRHALDCLRRDDTVGARTMLETMDEVLSLLTTLDYPDALTAGLRRTCDALRAVVERTRGDVTLALVQENLRRALQSANATDVPD